MTFDHGPDGDPLAVTRYHDGDMSPEEEEAFDAHLDTCDACRALLRQAVVVLPALDDALGPPPLTEAQREALLARLRGEAPGLSPEATAAAPPAQGVGARRPRQRPGPHWARRVALGVLAAAAVAAALALFNRGTTQTTAAPTRASHADGG